ncbi:hypothetical protein DL240_16015 [Lujinxingia litoralis]|uniref:SCP domain-containing protein n=1 Tax=Lujinxingia litoralis TaxID=2211119 RepID=A0A328C7L5_9DELT|nr:CAP domain-containing protein [Lujinxingia litoralis]RAL20545.1 hypothetical protein DL240_16015 [Lujinxingia litoralis]
MRAASPRSAFNLPTLFTLCITLGVIAGACVPDSEPSTAADRWEFEDATLPPAHQRIEQVIAATNHARARQQTCGRYGVMPAVAPVAADRMLAQAAAAHARDLATMDHLSHTGSDGSDFTDRAARAGFNGQPVGENIAATFRLGPALVQGWLESDAHCRVLMNPDARYIGVGLHDPPPGAPFTTYWVQVFGH